MRVLVACEFSGIVRDAFIAQGHDAVSCDLLRTERPGPHLQRDVRSVLDMGWDLMVAHPPCYHLSSSGSWMWEQKIADGRQAAALDFVRLLLDAPIERIALENPIGAISTNIRRWDQKIQPWQFGHPETKAICLWLKNLPPLQPTLDVKAEGALIEEKIHRMGPRRTPNARRKERSRFYPGVAAAMAQQWGALP